MAQFEFIRNKKEIKHKSEKECNRVKLYNSQEWKNLSRFYKMELPLCEVCLLEGKVSPVENVHHCQKFNDQKNEILLHSLLTDRDNLVSVCLDCHNKIHDGGKELTDKQKIFLKEKKEKLFMKYIKQGIVITLSDDKNQKNHDKLIKSKSRQNGIF